MSQDTDYKPLIVANIREMLKTHCVKPFDGQNYHVPVHPASPAGRYFRRFGYTAETKQALEAAIQRRLSHARA